MAKLENISVEELEETLDKAMGNGRRSGYLWR